jgi:hypothetical protein
MGKGSAGSFIKGLELGIIIKVALAFLPMVLAKMHQSGVAYSYVSDTRGGGVDVTDPAIVARNIQRAQYRILNAGKPPSLTRRERGKGIGTTRPRFVEDDEMNVGITGFPAYAYNNYYTIRGGRR